MFASASHHTHSRTRNLRGQEPNKSCTHSQSASPEPATAPIYRYIYMYISIHISIYTYRMIASLPACFFSLFFWCCCCCCFSPWSTSLYMSLPNDVCIESASLKPVFVVWPCLLHLTRIMRKREKSKLQRMLCFV